jgi:hypothetical protein
MIRQRPVWQRIGRGLILTTFLLFPMFMNYLSPHIIIERASQGVTSQDACRFSFSAGE